MNLNRDLIAELMNSLAAGRVTLNACLATLTKQDERTPRPVGDQLMQQIEDTLKEIEVARLKVLKRLIPEV